MSSLSSLLNYHILPFNPTAISSPKPKSKHNDLVTLFATLQHTSTPILPIMWHPALLPVGEGGFGAVAQAIQDVRTNFAFKRIRDKDTSGADRNATRRAFEAVIAEVSVLGDERLRRHSHVANLEGVCWEVEKGTVWPVLVSEKADHGDLREFMKGDRGKQMACRERLEICSGIAKGVQALHAVGVLHGDLKPENVLIFPGEDGRVVPRITDFGYSCIGIGNEDLVLMPDPDIWTAPECEGRRCLLQDAKNADWYSFGLLCVFVLFNQSFRSPQSPEAADHVVWLALQNDASEDTCEEFQRCKFQGKIDSMAVKLIESQQDFSDVERAALCDLLRNTLALESSDRWMGTTNLRLLVQNDSYDAESIGFNKTSISTTSCKDFKVSRLISQLSLSENSVRSALIRQLEETTLEAICPTCAQECIPTASFQLALCCQLGFGIEQDRQKSDSWLQRSGRSEPDISDELDWIKENCKEIDFGTGLFKELWDLGHVRTLNYAQDYRERGVLEEAKMAHAMEALNVESILGETHIVTLNLKSVLSSILRDDRCWEEAEKIELKILNARLKSSGSDHPDSLVSMRNMMSIQRNLGGLEEAERMGRALLPSAERVYGPRGSDTLTIMGDLATVLLARGKLNEAEQLYLAVAEIERSELGNDHPDTIITLANLAMTYKDQDRLEDAERSGIVAMNLFETILGSKHPSTLTTKSNLAAIFVEQGKYSEAEKLSQQVTTARKALFGTDHPQTLFSMRVLASCKMGLEQYHEAEQSLAEILEAQKYKLGEQHPNTIDTMSVLASAVSAQGKVKEAEVLEAKVVELSKDCLGESHIDTLIRISNLAVTYQDQERWDEAEKLQVFVIEQLTAGLGPEVPTVFKIKGNLARTYRGQKRLEDAEVLARAAWQGLVDILGSEHPSTQKTLMVLISILVSQDRIQEAKELQQ